MSWSFTLNGDVQGFTLTQELLEQMMSQHLEYASDMQHALLLAKSLGMKSAVCTGFRTPNPYGGEEVIEISVKGTASAVDFNAMIKAMIGQGPECTHDILSDNGKGQWVCERCEQIIGSNTQA